MRYQYRYEYQSREGKKWTEWMTGEGDLDKLKMISKKTDKATRLRHEFREMNEEMANGNGKHK